MTTQQLILLSFERGYHVGWRSPQPIIDHITLLRALISMSHTTRVNKCADLIINGKLSTTALLPTAKCIEGKLKLLTIFPRLPVVGKASGVQRLLTTLTAVIHILKYTSECVKNNGRVFVTPIINMVKLECLGVQGIKPLELPVKKGVVLKDVKEQSAIEPLGSLFEVFEMITEYRNRIDRLSGAADVFQVYGYKPRTPLWLALIGENEAVKCAIEQLEILQVLGIGGLRSRGWGKFTVIRDVSICDEDLEVLKNYLGWSIDYNYLLGFMTPGTWVDSDRSYALKITITGRAGPSHNAYKLPVLEVMDIGSLVYAKKHPQPFTLSLSNNSAVIVFNPVVLHAH